MLFSKLSTKSSIGITTICGICGGVVTWQMLEDEDGHQDKNPTSIVEKTIEEYLVEIKESTKTSDAQQLINNEINGGNEKNYACQWTKNAAKTKKDEKCKLIKLTFTDKKSLNLNQISEMNTEISANDIKDKKNLFKLKISSNYVFDLNNPIDIRIVDKNENNTIFTILTPKFKISNPTVEGNTTSFLVKLSKTTTGFSGNKQSPFSCKWVSKDVSQQISHEWNHLTGNDIKSVKNCNIYRFKNKPTPTSDESKIVELNLNDIDKITTSLPLMTYISTKKLQDYFIINLPESKDFLSIEKILNKYDLVLLDYQDPKLSYYPKSIFTIETPLAVTVNNSDVVLNANLILLN